MFEGLAVFLSMMIRISRQHAPLMQRLGKWWVEWRLVAVKKRVYLEMMLEEVGTGSVQVDVVPVVLEREHNDHVYRRQQVRFNPFFSQAGWGGIADAELLPKVGEGGLSKGEPVARPGGKSTSSCFVCDVEERQGFGQEVGRKRPVVGLSLAGRTFHVSSVRTVHEW